MMTLFSCDRIIQFASWFTGERAQSDLGYNFSQICNLLGCVDDVEWYDYRNPGSIDIARALKIYK